jgi:hypothetical protein
MDWKNARSVETKIRRLTREIERIDAVFYESEKAKERDLYVGMLERKRDDRVRSVVLQMHTAIEDILNDLMTCRILGIPPDERHGKTRSKSARALHKLFVGGGSIGFERKLNLAIAMGLIKSKTQEQLLDLNRLRNRCSHNWLLRAPLRRGRKPQEKKPPLLLYRGRDLHNVPALEELTREYGILYVKLYGQLYKLTS